MKITTGLEVSDIILSFDNLQNMYNQSAYDNFGRFYNTTEEANAAFTNSFNSAQTFCFASIVILQIFGNLMSTRTHVRSALFQQVQWRKSTRNLYIHGAQFISAFIMIIAVYVTLVNDIFQSAPFPIYLMLIPIGFSCIIIVAEEFRKLMVRKKLLYFHLWGW
jgi:hypothetical protein